MEGHHGSSKVPERCCKDDLTFPKPVKNTSAEDAPVENAPVKEKPVVTIVCGES
jgi:hypothetical protein